MFQSSEKYLTQRVNYNTVNLQAYNSFQVHATASKLSSFSSVTALKKLIKSDNLRKFVLGGGSNVLFTKHMHAHVLLNQIESIRIKKDNAQHAYVEVGAGVNWHHFVLWSLDHQLSGIENLSLIPGKVGAAPIQNIGAYGVEQKDCFEYLEAIDLVSGKSIQLNHHECAFGYRESIFKHEARLKYCITKVVYRLNKVFTPNLEYGAISQQLDASGIVKPSAKDVSDVIIDIRSSKLPDPSQLGNAGSFFKNPVISIEHYHDLKSVYAKMPCYPVDKQSTKVPAGWLIEQCGWKGKRVGQVGCYEKQALVIVNYGETDGSKIQQHALNIKKSVFMKFGINLQNEVNIF